MIRLYSAPKLGWIRINADTYMVVVSTEFVATATLAVPVEVLRTVTVLTLVLTGRCKKEEQKAVALKRCNTSTMTLMGPALHASARGATGATNGEAEATAAMARDRRN